MTIPELLQNYQAPANTPQVPIINFAQFDILQKLTEITEPLKTIAEFLSYILHPSKLLMLLWYWTSQLSYVICLLVCLASVLAYIFGYKKYSKLAPASIIVYTLIQAIGSIIGR